ncbi:heavy-metal-associated domain-containing protein [Novosphingobium aquiterrae]|uniref:Heavy-metal-associated domain-containing protein n=1 Tax=Novosphingobium aquiterrae TaxID=624388 RepID=A0ABV6PPB1_9SPHN
MKKTLLIGLAVVAMAGTGVAYALAGTAQGRPAASATAQRQTTFTIENMTCATCPITVRKAMEGVAGVSSVQVDFTAKTARATYDPKRTTAAQIAAASANAGYPARAVQN